MYFTTIIRKGIVTAMAATYAATGLQLKKYDAAVPKHFLGVHNKYAEITDITETYMFCLKIKYKNIIRGI